MQRNPKHPFVHVAIISRDCSRAMQLLSAESVCSLSRRELDAGPRSEHYFTGTVDLGGALSMTEDACNK
jgi:hypothetical protein